MLSSEHRVRNTLRNDFETASGRHTKLFSLRLQALIVASVFRPDKFSKFENFWVVNRLAAVELFDIVRRKRR